VASSGSATSTSPEARPASTSSAITRRARAKTSTSPNPASWNSTWCRAWLARAKSYEAATSRSTRAAVAPAPAGSGGSPSSAASRICSRRTSGGRRRGCRAGASGRAPVREVMAGA
jgi:hypothetical protein